MKLLIIRFSSIGDIVLTTPVIRCLKKQIPDVEIHYITKKSYQPVINNNPYINKAHYLEDNFHELMERLNDENFDYVIDLHHNLRTLKVKRFLKKKSFSFNKLNIEKWLMTALKINRLPTAHIVDRYMETVQSFGVKNDGAGLDYFINEEEKIKENDIPASHQAGYIAVVIGAAVNTKKYPLHKLKDLCTSLDHPIILLGGVEDAENGNEISSIDSIKIYNACGKFSLNESADLVRRAKLVVTNDTGLMHIATAFKRPVISLWGNTIPEFGMYPYYGKNYIAAIGATVANRGTNSSVLPYDILEIKNLSCRPCSKIGYKKCPKGHFKCMELMDPNEIINKIENRIRKKYS